MESNPYQVLGRKIAPLMGRLKELALIESRLGKKDPECVSVLGPRFYGKTTFLNHLAERWRRGRDPYRTSMFLDLRVDTPRNNNEFVARLAGELKNALRSVGSKLADDLDGGASEDPFDRLDFVLEELCSEGGRLLAVMDGFDYLLKETDIDKSLWDRLRSLVVRHQGLVMITGSNLPLRELCDNLESRGSYFWSLFNAEPLRLGAFQDSDWAGLLEPLTRRGVEIQSSARKELSNWTGGVPILTIALLHRIFETTPGFGRITKDEVDVAGAELRLNSPEFLPSLWKDLPDELRADLTAIYAGADSGLERTRIRDGQRTDLERRGLVRSAGSKVLSSCRLMECYANTHEERGETIRRLFGPGQESIQHIQTLLENRLETIDGVDPELKRRVRKVIVHLQPDPVDVANFMRSVVQGVLDIIAAHESPSNRSFPPQWITDWQHSGVTNPPDRWPRDGAKALFAVKLMTGAHQNTVPVAQKVTRGTYVLLNHLHEVGNFGQHPHARDRIDLSSAVAWCWTCVAMVESLTRDVSGR